MGVLYSSKTSQFCLRKMKKVNSQSLRVAFVDISGDLSDRPDNHGRNAVALEWCWMSHLKIQQLKPFMSLVTADLRSRRQVYLGLFSQSFRYNGTLANQIGAQEVFSREIFSVPSNGSNGIDRCAYFWPCEIVCMPNQGAQNLPWYGSTPPWGNLPTNKPRKSKSARMCSSKRITHCRLTPGQLLLLLPRSRKNGEERCIGTYRYDA